MNQQLSPASPAHLSEEALNDLLIGIRTPEAEAHLDSCELCRGRVADFRSGMALFNQTTLAASETKIESGSESQSGSMAQAAIRALRASRRQPRPTGSRLLAWKPLTAATAALLLALAAGWNYRHKTVVLPETSVSQRSGEFEPAEQIAEDNKLLSDVYNALDEQPSASVSDLPQANFSQIGTARPDTLIKARTQ